jgi:uridine kinase
MNYIICGPAGAGKSTYVRQNMNPGDLVVDLDAIYHAVSYLGNHRKPSQLFNVALRTQSFLIGLISPDYEKNDFPNAWVIVSGAKLSERKYLKEKLNAKIIMFDVEQHECLRRIEKDDERRGFGIPWGQIVKKWWLNYEPGEV